MLFADIHTVDQVTEAQVNYLASYAQTLSLQDDFAIQNFADSVMASPDAQAILQQQSPKQMHDEGIQGDLQYTDGLPKEAFALSIPQENSILTDIWPKITDAYAWLRKKVKTVFCEVAAEFDKDDDLDLKGIIRQVLVVLVPVLAASTGLMPVALPIVVSLAATLIKYGVQKVCPV